MKAKWYLVLLGVLAALSLATMPGCGPFHYDSFGHVIIGNLLCHGGNVMVLPGQSVELMNPCEVEQGATIDGQWLTDDWLETGDCNIQPLLPGVVNGIKVRGEHDSNLTRRNKWFLDADLTAQPKVDFPVCFIYHNGRILEPGLGSGTLSVTTTAQSPSGFKVGVQIPFDTPDGQVSVTVGNNVCLATFGKTCTQQVPGGTQVLLTVVQFPAKTTKLFDWNNVTCDISRTPTTCTFTVTKDTSVVPVFL